MEWKIQNGSPMPDPMTSIAGARVIFVRNGKVLVIEDQNLPSRLMLPGGSVDNHELIHVTALREARRS
jgi:ADP-ribose pyrophosphatase YjhB (NUDIX family)